MPLTHFLRIARGILLKGNALWKILPEIWPIALCAAIALTIGVKRYRQTLDQEHPDCFCPMNGNPVSLVT